MATGEHLYAITKRKRLIDLEPTKRGQLPLVWNPERHEWVDMELTFVEHVDSVPITDEQAKRFMKTGEISAVFRGGRMEPSDDSPDSGD